jgi:glycosyltransferase 2 family protein
VASIGKLGEPGPAPEDAERLQRFWVATRRALVTGVREALAILRARHLGVLVGAIGYWAFDNLVLWATFHAVGASPAISVILMGYLIGQLGGALPLLIGAVCFWSLRRSVNSPDRPDLCYPAVTAA